MNNAINGLKTFGLLGGVLIAPLALAQGLDARCISGDLDNAVTNYSLTFKTTTDGLSPDPFSVTLDKTRGDLSVSFLDEKDYAEILPSGGGPSEKDDQLPFVFAEAPFDIILELPVDILKLTERENFVALLSVKQGGLYSTTELNGQTLEHKALPMFCTAQSWDD